MSPLKVTQEGMAELELELQIPAPELRLPRQPQPHSDIGVPSLRKPPTGPRMAPRPGAEFLEVGQVLPP